MHIGTNDTEEKGMKLWTFGILGQWSMSHEAKDRFGALAEASLCAK